MYYSLFKFNFLRFPLDVALAALLFLLPLHELIYYTVWFAFHPSDESQAGRN